MCRMSWPEANNWLCIFIHRVSGIKLACQINHRLFYWLPLEWANSCRTADSARRAVQRVNERAWKLPCGPCLQKPVKSALIPVGDGCISAGPNHDNKSSSLLTLIYWLFFLRTLSSLAD